MDAQKIGHSIFELLTDLCRSTVSKLLKGVVPPEDHGCPTDYRLVYRELQCFLPRTLRKPRRAFPPIVVVDACRPLTRFSCLFEAIGQRRCESGMISLPEIPSEKTLLSASAVTAAAMMIIGWQVNGGR